MTPVNQERALTILSPLAALLVWQLASDAGLVNQRYVPSPLKIGAALVTMSLPVRALTSTPATPGIWLTSSWMAASQCLQLIPLTWYSLVGMRLLSEYTPWGYNPQFNAWTPGLFPSGWHVPSARGTQWCVSRLHHTEVMGSTTIVPGRRRGSAVGIVAMPCFPIGEVSSTKCPCQPKPGCR